MSALPWLLPEFPIASTPRARGLYSVEGHEASGHEARLSDVRQGAASQPHQSYQNDFMPKQLAQPVTLARIG